jgi:hypothetical protein
MIRNAPYCEGDFFSSYLYESDNRESLQWKS